MNKLKSQKVKWILSTTPTDTQRDAEAKKDHKACKAHSYPTIIRMQKCFNLFNRTIVDQHRIIMMSKCKNYTYKQRKSHQKVERTNKKLKTAWADQETMVSIILLVFQKKNNTMQKFSFFSVKRIIRFKSLLKVNVYVRTYWTHSKCKENP